MVGAVLGVSLIVWAVFVVTSRRYVDWRGSLQHVRVGCLLAEIVLNSGSVAVMKARITISQDYINYIVLSSAKLNILIN